MEVKRSKAGLFLHQTKYSLDLLQKCNMVGSKPCSSPCTPGAKLSITDGEPVSNPTEYRSLVGALQYLTWSRPEIAYAVNRVCQFMHSPTTVHLSSAKRILRYIKGTLGHGILFTKGLSAISGYCDADWAGDPDTRRSTSGFCLFFSNNPISWSAKKQPTVSRSSTEDEYKCLVSTAVEVLWAVFTLMYTDSSGQLTCEVSCFDWFCLLIQAVLSVSDTALPMCFISFLFNKEFHFLISSK
ncbi:uncharacterized protein LOC113324645 [Papaver somniferum]|uniref:uncharacterized protein LOC113324645 n=1 Tax=Papaver somniferum TaxID=3469 RepID=UPI000E6FCC16|nr:uncharacterized protein LOC113324645 [Papaver somniferum]